MQKTGLKWPDATWKTNYPTAACDNSITVKQQKLARWVEDFQELNRANRDPLLTSLAGSGQPSSDFQLRAAIKVSRTIW